LIRQKPLSKLVALTETSSKFLSADIAADRQHFTVQTKFIIVNHAMILLAQISPYHVRVLENAQSTGFIHQTASNFFMDAVSAEYKE
jgi:hypothetical protein